MADYIAKQVSITSGGQQNGIYNIADKEQAAGHKVDFESRSSMENSVLISSEPVLRLVQLGLFDVSYYTVTYPDVVAGGADPFEHFFLHGFKEGRRPNLLFDPLWYLKNYHDVREAGFHPLLHYATVGEAEGRCPSPLFQPTWYREQYDVPLSDNALAHYLRHRRGPFSPFPEFDSKYYLDANSDIALAGVDPFEHFLYQGYKEGRDPSSKFNTQFYIRRYLKGKTDQNPLLHYLEHRHEVGVFPSPPDYELTIPSEIKRFTKPGALFEEFRSLPRGARPRAKILAYYLPQFHSFPENDNWWGVGFTEWTNIARGIPRFKDHYQPRIPRDLGFYSLADLETMRKQVQLAKASGITGFVFYYYNFNGKRLLDGPIERFLKSDDITMPFSLMWANENWTRRWDGMDGEILIKQDYSIDDEERLLVDFARHFKDPRYIRIQGRPLLMIYRPGLIPNVANVISRWRLIFKNKWRENPLIVMSQSFDDVDPRLCGMDGAVEFPPHKLTNSLTQLNAESTILDDTFEGHIFSYDDVVQASLDEDPPGFPLIKTIIPSWDNDARRQGSGLVVHGSTPQKYEKWLSSLVERAEAFPFFGEPIICVNAWNEWCEGAYLEPDLHFGSAYLNATSRAVTGLTRVLSSPKILLVGHDAFPSGSQHLLLNIGKTLRTAYNVDVEFLLLAGGVMESEYRSVAPLTVLKQPSELPECMRVFLEKGVTSAIVNTAATGLTVKMLVDMKIRTISLIHELPRILKEKGLDFAAREAIANAHCVIFASKFVREKLSEFLRFNRDDDRFLVRPQGSYKQISTSSAEATIVRREFGLGPSAKLVLGVGYADLRKGFDLFLQVWKLVHRQQSEVHFCWVGGFDPSLLEWLGPEIKQASSTGRFHVAGYRSEMQAFYSASSVYALTSREDPFPTVALEAMSAGVPVVAFASTGGIPELLTSNKIGEVVPYCDAPAMADVIVKILQKDPDRSEGKRMAGIIEKDFSFVDYVRDLRKIAIPDLPAVSVVVPNYNYAHCLPDRLYSIFNQDHPVEEIIVLDDASMDSSVSVILKIADECQRDISLFINEENSGSVFSQWAKAAELASGEFIWIAEADDLSEPAFLSRLISIMKSDTDIAFGFTDSKSIDADGNHVFESYKPYFATLELGALMHNEVFNGREFALRYLAVKNTILNVSSVIWRRKSLLHAIASCWNELATYKLAGDWRLYLASLADPRAKIAYVADPLNVHRRHPAGVTQSLSTKKHIEEIRKIHGVVEKYFKVSTDVRRSQASYIDEVTVQLRGK